MLFPEIADRQYDYIGKIAQLYKCLQDEQSKALFWARLQFEVEPNMDTAVRFAEISKQKQESPLSKNIWREEFAKASENGKKIILYGAGGNGQMFAQYILSSQVDFYGFCDKDKHGETICGKPVLSPAEVIANPASFAVGITTERYYKEMLQFLLENAFPKDSILHCFDFNAEMMYFEFPEFYKNGTAFVDAGSFDGSDSIYFSKWCQGAYSKIFAFEPDEENYRLCKKNIESENIPNVILLQSGLSNSSGEAAFAASSTRGSYLISTGQVEKTCSLPAAESTTISICALDHMIDVEVGMIKMDIEGAEFDALHGAKMIIQRDKPLLAICIYHRKGDMLAIMDYLHRIVPEYRFWIRHYGMLSLDTVLYAAI